MAFSHKSQAYTITSTADVIASASPTRPRTFLVQNNDGTNPIYVGGSDVTTSNGLKIAAGQTLSINCGGSLYAVSGGSIDVRVLEVVTL